METAEPVTSKSPVQYVVHGYSNQPAVHVDQTTAERVAATRRIEVAEVSPSVADGILKNAAGSTAELTALITETGKFPIRSGILRLQHWITEWAIGKGWLVPGQPRELLHQLMLVVSELSEACEAHREGNPKCTRPNMGEFSHVEEELADAVIRILQIAGEHNFRVVDAIIAKMEFNETRPVKHGKLC
jgi:NTP pyrophosphatase (non-canonical NTP hydrolase)